MNNPQIQNIAISIDQDEDGKTYYQAHVFMAPPDYRCIQLDPYPTQAEATKSAEDFLEIIRKIDSDVPT